MKHLIYLDPEQNAMADGPFIWNKEFSVCVVFFCLLFFLGGFFVLFFKADIVILQFFSCVQLEKKKKNVI